MIPIIFKIKQSEAATGGVKKGVLKFLAKFTGKHLCDVFFYEFCEVFKNTLFTEHLRATSSEH